MNIFNEVIAREGGFSDDVNDRGHQKRVAKGDKWDSYVTKYGVTQFTLSDYRERQASKDEVRKLSKDVAREIYRRMYFISPRIDQLPVPLHAVVFDMAVNSGVRRAILLLQTLLNDAGFRVAEDGMIGAETIVATNRATEKFGGYFVNAYVEERLYFYGRLIHKDSSQLVFAKSWKRRALSFLIEGYAEEVSMKLSSSLTETAS